MQIVDAMTLRDGGTACVSVNTGEVIVHVTIDYQLPWDGRARFMYTSGTQFGRDRRLDIDSDEERRWIATIRALTQKQISLAPPSIPGWGREYGPKPFALRFLEIVDAERVSRT